MSQDVNNDTFPLLITCPRELPPYLAREVEALGLPIVAMHPAGVETRGTFADAMRLNLHVRTGHRVLLRLHQWTAHGSQHLYDGVHSVRWEDWLDPDGYVSVVSSVDTPSIDNTQFANLRCKDAIVDRMRNKTGRRPDSGPRTDRAVVFLYWHDSTAMIYLDTSGTALSDRGYRLHPAKAPLRETLAAAIVMATVWEPGQAFVNPMCGSGTLAIEAAMIAGRRAPGLTRTNFGFMHVLPYDDKAWKAIVAEARAQIRTDDATTIHAGDVDRRAIDAARANARAAGVEASIRFTVEDFRRTAIPSAPGIVILNPEYGIRLGDVDELRETYHDIGDFFKQRCQGFTGYVFTGNLELAKEIGLRSKRRIPFWTADIECRLLEFPLYAGTKKVRAQDDEAGPEER